MLARPVARRRGGRAIYLLQASRGPAFAEPMIDALTYHDLAIGLARDGVYDARMLWQAPL